MTIGRKTVVVVGEGEIKGNDLDSVAFNPLGAGKPTPSPFDLFRIRMSQARSCSLNNCPKNAPAVQKMSRSRKRAGTDKDRLYPCLKFIPHRWQLLNRGKAVRRTLGLLHSSDRPGLSQLRTSGKQKVFASQWRE
ncbi:hypothetical protein TNCV_2664151 [Trichonephila clavipes]|nr:hypothetical protein TNCV_2664151 [Trichonephila clavipes]